MSTPGCRQRRRMNCHPCSRTAGSKTILNISFKSACRKHLTGLSVRANAAPSDASARQPDRNDSHPGDSAMPREPIELELLPHERAALLKWNFTPQVQDQLKNCASSDDVETITLSPVDLNWLASDLTHVIVKRGCR